MDRFVTRRKTLNYTSLAAHSLAEKNPILKEKTTVQQAKKSGQKKTLQPKQLNELGQTNNDLFRTNQANTESINSNSSDSGLSSASGISPQQLWDNNGGGSNGALYINNDCKKFNSTPTRNHLGKLADYVDCSSDKENYTYMTINHEPISHQKKVEAGITFQKIVEVIKKLPTKTEAAAAAQTATPEKQRQNHNKMLLSRIQEDLNSPSATAAATPENPLKNKMLLAHIQKDLNSPSATAAATPENPLKNNKMLLARIQKDLNSPSAASRLKAIKALKSPTKSAYSHFDVPEAEQSLNIPEPPSLQEIMRNIVVYVEVRSGEDNRSTGVRKVIEALGARVNLSLLRDTTHVVFKDGLLSTFKKATQMGIPIVSILWIEACKNQRRICDPKDYPISNLDRYENPELYDKMKRIKSMQPDSECNKRIRAKVGGGTPRGDSTPTQKTGALKKTSTLIGGDTPTSSTNKKKTDISQYFKKLEKSTPNTISKIGGCDTVAASPATQLLNRINLECSTPLEKETTKKHCDNEQRNGDANPKEPPTQMVNANACNSMCRIKKALDFLEADTPENVVAEKQQDTKDSIDSDKDEENVNKRNRRRRSSSVIVKEQQVLKTKLDLQVPQSPIKKTKPRRRHSLMPVSEIETATESMNSMSISITPKKAIKRRDSLHTTKDMSVENSKVVSNIETITEEESSIKSVSKRRTLYDVAIMNQTDLMDANKAKEKSAMKSTRRRTIYASKTMETSEVKIDKGSNNTSNVTTRRRTCYRVKSIEQTTEIIDEAKTPVVKTVFCNKTKELINNEDVKTTPDKPINRRRRTLYTPATNNTATLPVDNSLTTPTNFKTGEIASSTLLDSVEKTKLCATPLPAADATNGKLLEETGQCVTPLIFSSTRLPGSRRRTMFDASMDIITQRLQSINQSARRSLVPPTPSAEVAYSAIDDPSINTASIMNTCSAETLVERNEDRGGPVADVNFARKKNGIKRKRKLFMPNELNTPPPIAALLNFNTKKLPIETTDPLSTPKSNRTTNSASKRRRTLMPISQPQPTTTEALKPKSNASNAASSALGAVSKRRSTLDFEQIQNNKTKNVNVLNNNNGDPTTSAPSTNMMESSKAPTTVKAKQVLVYTNMHHQQIDVIHEAINKLGLFNLENSVNDTTTHLVSLEPRRTLNLLRALTRGLWILEYTWISDSLNAGKWLPEETYELKNFSRAIEVCRSERQAFGANYKCELFREIGTFYISSHCYPLTKENMRELIMLCGGRVVNNRQKAHYIIGDCKHNLENKIYLTPYWVIDCITQMHLMKPNNYKHPLTNEKLPSTTATT